MTEYFMHLFNYETIDQLNSTEQKKLPLTCDELLLSEYSFPLRDRWMAQGSEFSPRVSCVLDQIRMQAGAGCKSYSDFTSVFWILQLLQEPSYIFLLRWRDIKGGV